jgi:hypothetical protein
MASPISVPSLRQSLTNVTYQSCYALSNHYTLGNIDGQVLPLVANNTALRFQRMKERSIARRSVMREGVEGVSREEEESVVRNSKYLIDR